MSGDRITFERDGWHFTCAPCRSDAPPSRAFMAMAKREPFTTFHPVHEPGDLWFEFGASAEEALAKLAGEVAMVQTGALH